MIMEYYDEIRDICERTSRISERVVDDFLIPYAAGHQGLEKKMKQLFGRYRQVTGKLGKKVLNMLMNQYLAHRVFRKEGLLERFLKHPALDRFTGADREFLLMQLKHPWRFSFSVIKEKPAADFYTMEDVLSGERFLLYSQGISTILGSVNPVLWFNLIGFNGSCWQSYGPLVYYNGFEPGDLWFFATELDPDLEEPSEIPSMVERDPLPFMMLVSGSNLPLTFHRDDQLLFLLAEHDMDKLDTSGLKKIFRTEYDSGVYRISHKQMAEHPHFAQAYFDEENHLLLFSAMTDRGFKALVNSFNACGHDFPSVAYLRVNMTMLTTASGILNKKIVLNEYLDLFKEESDPEKDKIVEDINAFIALVLPEINAGREPDIDEAARLTGVDPETAKSVVASVMDSLENMPGEMPKGGKQVSASKNLPEASGKLPAQPKEGIRLLSSDDDLLLDLHLYMKADELRRMAPWEFLSGGEFFGVQVPGKDLIYFVNATGQSGDFKSVAFYRGFRGISGFWNFQAQLDRFSRLGLSDETLLQTSAMIWGPLTIPHLMLYFTDREMLSKESLEAVRKSGVRFRGKRQWPQIEETVPGYAPVYPGREKLTELFLVMQQAVSVLERVENGEVELFRENDPPTALLIRIPVGKGPGFKWKDHYLIFNPAWGREDYDADVDLGKRLSVSNLPEANQVLQLELFILPNPVRVGRNRAYFPFVLLFVDKHSEMVVSVSVHPPEPDLRSLYRSLPRIALEELLKSGHRPSEIEIRTELLFGILSGTLKEAGCRVKLVDHMPETDEAIVSLISHMG